MIGDTSQEVIAFYLGLGLGCYIGLKIAFIIWFLRTKKVVEKNITL